MHVEQTPVASSASSNTTTNSTTAITNTITTNTITTNTISTNTISTTNNNTITPSGAGSRHILPRISVYSGITDRQTVQVLQQALNGQPGTAARYLQQMYVAQQQHLMLQTAALNTTQLHSLGPMQQGTTLVARHPTSTQNTSPVQQTGHTQTTINLTVPVTTAAQLISRSQSGSSAANGVPQTAVILRNASNPVLTASQAQMYLRAQMLFLTPTAAINATKEDWTQPSTQQQSSGAQNLSMCRIQGPTPSPPTTTTTSSSSTTPCAAASAVQLQGLCLKQTSGCNQFTVCPVPGQGSSGQGPVPGQGLPGQGKVPEELEEGPGPQNEAPSEGQKREVEVRGLMSVSQCLTTLTQHPLISTACAQIQMQPQHQQHKQHSTGIQQQHAPQQSQLTLLHTHTRAQVVQTLAIQPQMQPQPVLPKAPVPSLPAAIFHSLVRPTSQVLSPSEPVPDQNPDGPASDRSQPAQGCAQPDFQNQLTAESANNTIPAAQQIMPLHVPANSDMSAYKTEGEEEEEEAAGCGLNVKCPGVSSAEAPAMTSGNGNNAPTVTGSAPAAQNGESKPPPQAIVKPHILTHLIGGFVIQEGAEPFPVERPSFSIESLRKHKHYSERHNHNSEMEDLSSQELKKQQDEPMLTCELCGRVDFAYIFKGSKRFCSTVCAKRYNVGCSKRVSLFSNRRTAMENLKKQRTLNGTHRNSSFDSKKKVPPPSHQKPIVGAVTAGHLAHPAQGESSQCSDMSNYERPLSPLSAAAAAAQRSVHPARGAAELTSELPLLSHSFLACDPGQWNVEDVYEFICSLPGCLEIAEEFRSQEIDGQALLLLKEDHLMGTMNIKLGPALKIYAQISMLKDS